MLTLEINNIITTDTIRTATNWASYELAMGYTMVNNARSLMEYVLSSNTVGLPRIKCVLSIKDDKDMCECNICYEEVEKRKFVKFNCGHDFCGKCIKRLFKFLPLYVKSNCPYCRTEINSIEFASEEIKSDFRSVILEETLEEVN
jgi:hypothetical protein